MGPEASVLLSSNSSTRSTRVEEQVLRQWVSPKKSMVQFFAEKVCIKKFEVAALPYGDVMICASLPMFDVYRLEKQTIRDCFPNMLFCLFLKQSSEEKITGSHTFGRSMLLKLLRWSVKRVSAPVSKEICKWPQNFLAHFWVLAYMQMKNAFNFCHPVLPRQP